MTQNTNVTLKTLTAHELLSARENMCELFGLVDDSERRAVVIGDHRDEDLQALKEKLNKLKTDVEAARSTQ